MLNVRRGTSRQPDTERAALEIAKAIAQDGPALGVVFASPRYDFPALARLLAAHLPFPVIGCSTAGQVTREHGYSRDGIEALSIAAPGLAVATRLIEDISTFDLGRAVEVSDALFAELGTEHPRPGHAFAFVLLDGLSRAEERVASELYGTLRGLPIIGGSAGDDLAFERTFVFANGLARTGAAVLCVAESPVPVLEFHEQHFTPTERRMVITAADPSRRLVTEIDGKAAALAYAHALGLRVDELSAAVFSANPVTVMLDGQPWVRSIQRVDGEGLVFYCAVAVGMVLRLARGSHQLERLDRLLGRLDEEVGGASLILGCDCILRRLELEGRGELDEAGRVLARAPFFGFSTYGELRGAVHVNHTLTGLAFGGGPRGTGGAP